MEHCHTGGVNQNCSMIEIVGLDGSTKTRSMHFWAKRDAYYIRLQHRLKCFEVYFIRQSHHFVYLFLSPIHFAKLILEHPWLALDAHRILGIFLYKWPRTIGKYQPINTTICMHISNSTLAINPNHICDILHNVARG